MNDYLLIAFMFIAIAGIKFFELFGSILYPNQESKTTSSTEQKQQNIINKSLTGLKITKNLAYIFIYGLIAFKFYNISHKSA